MRKFYFLSLLSFASLLSAALFAQTNVSAIISSNQTWSPLGSPYLISQNILIDSGVSVNILPGTIVQCTGAFRLIVDGELIANGNKDSMVIMDKVRIEFNKKAVGYNFNNASGSQFNYTWFKGDGLGGVNTIKLNDVSLFVTNSRFTNCYYAIYAYGSSYDTTKIKVTKTRFESDNGYGSPTSVSGNLLFLEMDECSVYNMCSMYVPANFKLTRSDINKLTCNGGIRVMNGNRTAKSTTHIACNTFRNFKTNVLEAFYLDTNTTVNILNNTFDSADVFINFYASINNNYKYHVSGNNFLTARLYDVKFTGSSQTAGQFVRHNMNNNYWGSTDSATIAAGIYDFNDDITAAYKVDFSNYLSSANTNCSVNTTGLTFQQHQSFSVFPNPGKGQLTLNFNEADSRLFFLYDLQGRQLLQGAFTEAQFKLDVSQCLSGTYMLMVRNANGTMHSQKISIMQ